jgi:hypothetical protein
MFGNGLPKVDGAVIAGQNDTVIVGHGVMLLLEKGSKKPHHHAASAARSPSPTSGEVQGELRYAL